MKVRCSWCITTLEFTAQSGKFEKFITVNTLSKSFITPLELFFKDFVDISYENAFFRMPEDSVWQQPIVFLPVKYIFSINRDSLN